jgi:hypothetical protein
MPNPYAVRQTRRQYVTPPGIEYGGPETPGYQYYPHPDQLPYGDRTEFEVLYPGGQAMPIDPRYLPPQPGVPNSAGPNYRPGQAPPSSITPDSPIGRALQEIINRQPDPNLQSAIQDTANPQISPVALALGNYIRRNIEDLTNMNRWQEVFNQDPIESALLATGGGGLAGMAGKLPFYLKLPSWADRSRLPAAQSEEAALRALRGTTLSDFEGKNAALRQYLTGAASNAYPKLRRRSSMKHTESTSYPTDTTNFARDQIRTGEAAVPQIGERYTARTRNWENPNRRLRGEPNPAQHSQDWWDFSNPMTVEQRLAARDAAMLKELLPSKAMTPGRGRTSQQSPVNVSREEEAWLKSSYGDRPPGEMMKDLEYYAAKHPGEAREMAWPSQKLRNKYEVYPGQIFQNLLDYASFSGWLKGTPYQNMGSALDIGAALAAVGYLGNQMRQGWNEIARGREQQAQQRGLNEMVYTPEGVPMFSAGGELVMRPRQPAGTGRSPWMDALIDVGDWIRGR